MSSATSNEEGEFGFQIAPMVDVVFVLLLFFMACAGQTITEGLLKVSTPGLGEAAPNVGNIVLDIDAAGNVFANGQAQSANPVEHQIPALESFLKSGTSANAEIAVQIRPTNETRHERVIDVLNTCRQANVKNIAFR